MKKINNKILFLILFSLLIIIVIAKYRAGDESSRNFKSDLLEIDSSSVAEILLYPKAEQQKEIKFFLKDNKWMITQGRIETIAESGLVKDMISQLKSIKSKRLAATSKEKWKELEITDSAATRVVLKNSSGTVLADVYFGKFSFRQGPNDPSGRPNFKGISYIRIAGEENVHAIDGFAAMTFNKGFNDWRDKTLLSFIPSEISILNYRNISGTTFTLEKKDSIWESGKGSVDFNEVENYLKSISNKKNSGFIDDFHPESIVEELTLVRVNKDPLVVTAYPLDSANFVLHSSLNKGAYFKSDTSGLYKEIFRPLEDIQATIH